MSDALKMFEKFLYEAEGDPPDTPDEGQLTDTADSPPEIPDDVGDGNGPPDLPEDSGDGSPDDAPPDIPDDGNFSDDFGDSGSEDDGGTDTSDEDPNTNLQLDDKVSAVMNMNLYKKFLSLLNSINSQLSIMKTHGDMLYTLASDSLDDSQTSLKKLNENIKLYLRDSFANEDYSKNLLFFNKCINLLKLLNDKFGQAITKGIKSVE